MYRHLFRFVDRAYKHYTSRPSSSSGLTIDNDRINDMKATKEFRKLVPKKSGALFPCDVPDLNMPVFGGIFAAENAIRQNTV